MNRITVIGSLNMDMVITAPRVPVLGETIMGSGFMTVPGGKGANQAAAASKLGGNVSLVGCVGDDLFGRSLLDNMKCFHVNVDYVRIVKGISTGIAAITICNGNNFIVLDSGANEKLDRSMIDAAEEIIAGSCLLMIQMEIPQTVVEYAVEIAHRNNVKVLLNPAPACELPDELLSKVDIFTPNEAECEIITGIPVHSVEDAMSAVRYLQKKGIQHVIITMGKNGAVYNNVEEIIHKSVPVVKAVDSTAAGDAFSGAVAVALSEGKTIDDAVEFGNKAGTLTVLKKGAQASLPSKRDIGAFDELVSKLSIVEE